MVYSKGCHTVYYHRYHVVWATKYRYDVLRGELRLRIREIIRQACTELGVEIIKGVLSRDHVHMFIAVPPQHAFAVGQSEDGIQASICWPVARPKRTQRAPSRQLSSLLQVAWQ